ncbi:MAG: zf-HC2 domain-containing protein [Gammaproteobacteria bacterium]|jgi:anti-sigma factor (TIGR02949 family)|nr:zf-HC2 domain-containing protein [Gammaproteobacteria bacterium]
MSEDHKNPEPDEIGCIEAINGLYAYLDGELDDPEAVAQFEDHLDHCRHCFSRRELERTLSERIRKSARERAPDELRKRLRNVVDKF